jgi:phospholipid/cholesterol/gamma-HCH transport system substrate-binding protein
VALPPALRQANTTFVNLRATLDDLDPLVETSKKATVNLAPFLAQSKRTAKRSVPVFRNLKLAVNRPGKNNDLASFTGDLPDVQSAAQTALPNAIQAMQCAAVDTSGCGGGANDDPFLRFARPYLPELLGFVTKFGQAGGYYDANGHFIRLGIVSTAFDYSAGTLAPNTPATRYNNYSFPILPELQFRRCPGLGTQLAGDGSTPFLDDGAPNSLSSGPPPADCNATQVPPGP